ncbi:hypothetical protein Rhopal_000246-T1 [Rhodotorula paludigena]|uniref:Methionine aminopeptidase 2 n=1 Tax=Rhodotorula paludigena TaxID=86838 RepID=A0AAV5GB34_9BASI|nr:hypothetical protein Rhopal_000246-T1 [Rhodotorula paludigena]
MATEAAAAAAPADELAQLALGDAQKDAAAPAAPAPSGGADGDDGDDDDGDDDVEGAATGAEKKKPKKKKKATVVQTEPPTVPVSRFFKDGNYPVGEECEYIGNNSWRTTSEEMRAKDREHLSLPDDSAFNYNAIRRAAEVHRQVRQYARANIKPGMSLTEIATMIEDGTRALVEENGMQSGIGFPTGVNRNHCAAHYSPNAGDKVVLLAEDTLKVDFGVHVNGRIVDSAFTLNFEPTYDNLLAAVQDATNAGVREAGIDVRMGDIGRTIQEVMESYEVEVGGKTHQVKSIRNLTGHSIHPYIIHGGKSVPIVAPREDDDEADVKMEEGEYFAIETFGSTGEGYVVNADNCSHYARIPGAKAPLRFDSSKKLLGVLDKQFGTLPWCKRYLDRLGEKNYTLSLRELVNTGIVQDYPPLVDIAGPGAQTAQFEHTILLRPTCKEVVSRGNDY